MVIKRPLKVAERVWNALLAELELGLATCLEEHFQQVVEEQPAALGRAQLLLPGLQQAFGLGLLQCVGNLRQRHAGEFWGRGIGHRGTADAR